MNQRKYTIFTTIWLIVVLAMSVNAQDMAPEDVEVAPLVPITIQNASQLTPWIPRGQDGQPSQEWIPISRGTLLTVSYSPEANLLAAGTSTGLYLLDPNDLQREPVYVPGFDDSVSSLSFSPDGTRLIVQSGTHPGHPKLYNTTTGRFVALAGDQELQLYANLQFSEDGTTVFGSGYSRDRYKIVSWNADTGARLSTDEIPQLSQFVVDSRPYQPNISLSILEDSYMTSRKQIPGVSNTETVVQVWDKDTLEQVQRITLSAEASTFFYAPQHNIFISTGYQNNYDGALIWNASTGGNTRTISADGFPHLASDETAIWFYDSEQGHIRVWDIETQQFVHDYDLESGQDLSYFADDRVITIASGSITIWQIQNEALTQIDRVEAFAGSSGDVLFTDSGDKLVVAKPYTGIEVWDTADWKPQSFIPIPKYIRAMALSPDSQSVAVAIGDGAPGDRLHVHDLETGAITLTLNYDYPFYSVAYHPTDDYLAVGRQRGFDLALYSTRSGTMTFRFVEGGIPYSIAFSPDGSLVASGNADDKVRVYDMITRTPAYAIDAGRDVNGLAFSHDGTVLAVGTSRLAFYDAATGQELRSSEYLSSDIYDMAFSPDDSLLATIREGSIALWNVAAGQLLWESKEGTYYGHVAFHPDGNVIVTDGTRLALWVVNTGADSDGDGVDDVLDACPAHPGDINGCPDSDGDGLVDTMDVCPNEAGTASGCPDDDGDGVGNPVDMCPGEIGSAAANGCPDEDADGIVDSEDVCPGTAGVEQFNGCPDTDSDDIADSDDACPFYAGTLENAGCPYTAHTNTNANVRTSPSTNGTIVRSIPPSEEFYLIGRNTAGDWLKIVLDPAGDATIAWVFQSLVVTDIEISTLPIQD